MSQNFFQIIRPVHVHLKTDKVDLKKRPPWKKFFLHIFSIHSSSRHEKRCWMLQRILWLFQCSRNQRCFNRKKSREFSKFHSNRCWLVNYIIRWSHKQFWFGLPLPSTFWTGILERFHWHLHHRFSLPERKSLWYH